MAHFHWQMQHCCFFYLKQQTVHLLAWSKTWACCVNSFAEPILIHSVGPSQNDTIGPYCSCVLHRNSYRLPHATMSGMLPSLSHRNITSWQSVVSRDKFNMLYDVLPVILWTDSQLANKLNAYEWKQLGLKAYLALTESHTQPKTY